MTIRQWLTSIFGDLFRKFPPAQVPPLPGGSATNPPPGTVTGPVGCGCDLSKPVAVPLVPALGNTDNEVDGALRQRWASGLSDNCGGLPGDVRPLLVRPAGKTFGWKYPVTSGKVSVRLNGIRMTLFCGPVTDASGNPVSQRMHPIGASDHEAPDNGKHPSTLPDWVPFQSGVEGPKKHFAYYEVRDT